MFLSFRYECAELSCVSEMSLKGQLILSFWCSSVPDKSLCVSERHESELWVIVFYIGLKMSCYVGLMSVNYRLFAFSRHDSEILGILCLIYDSEECSCVSEIGLKGYFFLFF